jgi:predicted  nucleic acid-binding Zn-ribbon protein
MERADNEQEKYRNDREQFEQAKETLTHHKEVWDKEVRRARKAAFKAEREVVKKQEELKSRQQAQKVAEQELKAEQERANALEQEAFEARSSLVRLQEQLNQAQERINMLEKELDATKTLVSNQEKARQSASIPDTEGDVDDLRTSRKRRRVSSISEISITNPDVEELMMLLQWEKQRADRALEQVHFLETECHLKVCPAAKALRNSRSSRRSSLRKRASLLDAGDPLILSEDHQDSAGPAQPMPGRSKTDRLRVEKEPRRSTIFLPAEGIFRTVSQAEAETMGSKSAESSVDTHTESATSLPITPTDGDPMYRRTPSVDPPGFAVLSKERTSLLSLLNAPHRQDPEPVFNIPTTSGPEPEIHQFEHEGKYELRPTEHPRLLPREISIPPREPTSSLTAPLSEPLPSTHADTAMSAMSHTRPHTTASYYQPTTTVTTTKVPLREEPNDGPTLAQRLLKMQRTPSRQAGDVVDPDKPSFDITNPALTPTMTREQALAQIRERRGRARSVGRAQPQGTTTTSAGAGSSTGSGADVRRKVSGASASGSASGEAPAPRRKASGELVGGRRIYGGSAGEDKDRGRERDRREVSAPSTGGAAAKRAVSNVRRVKS